MDVVVRVVVIGVELEVRMLVLVLVLVLVLLLLVPGSVGMSGLALMRSAAYVENIISIYSITIIC